MTAKILEFPQKAEPLVEPRVPLLRRLIHGVLHKRQPFVDPDRNEKIKAGTHRFDIYPGHAVCVRPEGYLVDREEDRKQRMERNSAAIELYDNRYVEVTDDGFIVREMG